MASLILDRVSKSFAGTAAVGDVSIDIVSGEFFSILGPSGCGKTTLLRIIAGFESPSSGAIFLDGKDITSTSPQFRGIGMVFQNYALFPHMTVFQNIAFGLQTQKKSRDEIEERVRRIVETVRLGARIHASVSDLSGGEQQRVAVARALVVEPAVLLFDEPLSNLDVALRLQTREEIRTLQRKTGITTVYVTHDQSEAMSLSDRIAVMRSGKVEQTGTPAAIYDNPGTPFVASFVGGANILNATVDRKKRMLMIDELESRARWQLRSAYDGPVTLALKPEAVAVSAPLRAGGIRGVIETKEYLGFTTNFDIRVGTRQLRASALSTAVGEDLQPGSEVQVTIDWSRCIVFPGGEA